METRLASTSYETWLLALVKHDRVAMKIVAQCALSGIRDQLIEHSPH